MKILIIGQAPPAVKQSVPYDTTMLYDMFSWVGISKDLAQKMFEFEAVYNEFPGHGSSGHLKPIKEQMDKHWNETLEEKVQMANTVILLGNVARDYFYSKPKTYSCNLGVFELIHPSYRNAARIKASKEHITKVLQSALGNEYPEYHEVFDPEMFYYSYFNEKEND